MLSQKSVSCLLGCCGGAVISIVPFLYRCIGKASTDTFRPFLSQSDEGVADLWHKNFKSRVASKTASRLLADDTKINWILQE